MAKVHIPTHWREHTDGRDTVEVPGRSLGAVVRALGDQYPELRRILLDEGALRGEIAIAINAIVTENNITEPVDDDDEIYLLPAIAGGAAPR